MTANATPLYYFSEKVRVRPVEGWFRRWLTPKAHRQLIGKVGHIIHLELGQNTRKPIYTVVFEIANSDLHSVYCFYENEIESAA